MNPFYTWAELGRALRDRFLAETRGDRDLVLSPHTGEILGQLAALVTQCEHLGSALDQLQRVLPVAYEAFERAERAVARTEAPPKVNAEA